MPSLFDEEITATYAGLRAAIDRDDYLIDVDARARYVLVGGIRSTGLTAGMAIAEHVTGLLDDAGLDVDRTRGSACAADGCRTSARPVYARIRTPNASPPIPNTAASSASASGSPRARFATRSDPPSRLPISTGCVAAPG